MRTYTDILVPEGSEITWNATTSQFQTTSEWRGAGDRPVNNLSYYGALFYRWAENERLGLPQTVDLTDWSVDQNAAGWRLPTKAEWDHAARGGLSSAEYAWDSGTYNYPTGNFGRSSNNDPTNAERDGIFCLPWLDAGINCRFPFGVQLAAPEWIRFV